jgi:hypothetical protein
LRRLEERHADDDSHLCHPSLRPYLERPDMGACVQVLKSSFSPEGHILLNYNKNCSYLFATVGYTTDVVKLRDK